MYSAILEVYSWSHVCQKNCGISDSVAGMSKGTLPTTTTTLLLTSTTTTTTTTSFITTITTASTTDY